MKPRIKSLLTLAHLDVMQDLGDIDTNFVAERFAELIIKECHEVIVVGGVDDLDGVMKHFEIE
jgi:hypothetical protein